MKPAYQILKTARAKLKECGWIQDDYGDATRGYCSLGAMGAAAQELSLYDGRDKAEDFLAKAIKTDNVPKWNDNAYRTKEQVLEAFSKAMRLAR